MLCRIPSAECRAVGYLDVRVKLCPVDVLTAMVRKA